MFKKVTKRTLALLACAMTIVQTIMPTYAFEQPETISVATSNVHVQVLGDGFANLLENGQNHVISKEQPFSGTFNVGTQLRFEIGNQEDLFITSFKENDVMVTGFVERSMNFTYEKVTTESDVNYVVSFEREVSKNNSGVTDENQNAEDEDVGEEGTMSPEDGNAQAGDQNKPNDEITEDENSSESSETEENSKEEEEKNTDETDKEESSESEDESMKDKTIDDYFAWATAEGYGASRGGRMARAGGDSFSSITGISIDGNAVINKGRELLGTRYVFGSKNPQYGGIDCSGFTTWTYRMYLGTMWYGGTQGGYGYAEEGNFRGDCAHSSQCNNGAGMYTMGAWDHVTGHYYMDQYGLGSPNLFDVNAWDFLLRNGKSSTRLNRGVYYSAATPNTGVPAEGWDFWDAGDIVIWYRDAAGNDCPQNSEEVHMGIYAGNGQVLDSDGSGGVRFVNINDLRGGGSSTGGASYRIFKMVDGKGSAKLIKKSANTEITDNNPCYSLAGAVYGVYSDASLTNQVGTFTTNEKGTSDVVELKAGTYYVKETNAPKGYALDPTVYSLTVQSGKTATLNVKDFPQSDPVGILLGKIDKETNANKPQGSASLKKAQFTVKYYKGLYDSDPAQLGKKPARTWVLETDSDGYTELNNEYKISGDDFYYNGTNSPTLPVGTVTIQETKAPVGYKINDEVFIRKITSEGTAENVNTYNEPIIKEQVYLGDFTIRKFITNGNESEIMTPEEGAEFIAIYKGYVDQYGSIEEAMKYTDEFGTSEWSTLVTDENGVGTSGKLAYGTYVVKQTAGTEETDILEESFEVTFTENGQHFEYTINNRPSDYYVKIVKKDADNGKIVCLNGATFQLVKLDDEGNPDANYSDNGAVKTDENGIVSVKSGLLWYDSFTTNADNRLSIIESLGRYEATTSEDKGSVTVPQKLPAGNYMIQEIETPDGYLIGQNVSFTLEKSNITETDPDGDAVVTIEYSDPKPTGRIELTKVFEDPDYIMHGEVTFDLYVTQDIVDPADGTVLYKAGDKYGTYTLNEENNTIVIEGLPMGVGESHFKLVEKTTYENYQLNTEEFKVDFVQADDSTPTYTAEITVENELIHIGTTALNADTNGKEFNSAKEITVTDTVSYEGLIPNQEYTMHATLMNKETGEAVLNEDGTQVEGYKKFTPTEANGTIDVTMTLDASQLGGQDYVVFESLLNSGLEGHETCEIAKHHDLTDENQTITILGSKIGTTALSENGSHEQQVTDGEITITDTVSYEGLVSGMTYKLSGTLMNKETGEKMLDADGRSITAETTFTPETSTGTMEVEFTFDASAIESGTSVVVFETLYEVHSEDGVNKEIEVATHEDIEDEGQTVKFIDIFTNASSENGSNEQQETEKEVTLTDTVTYEGLQIGEKYTVSGKLMNKETGKPLLDADGNEITAEATFTPEESNGTVDVEFIFDLTGIESGTDIVVFESLYHDGIEVAVHADIEDEDQTVHIIDVQTEAESQNGTHTAPTGSEVTIIDHVSYTNLEVGKEYKVSGKLMNKETGEPLLDADGNEITAETTFTPEESNGVVDLEYTLDSSLLAGKEIVVFEDLYKDEILVASHADIEDENQTIKFKNFEILVNKVDSITGNNIISKEFEFTMYSDKDLQEEVVTKAGNTEDGTALFEVTEGTWYIKETKAPEGYKLSDEVVKVEIKDNEMFVNDKKVETDEDYLYSIVYQDVLLPSMQTGSENHGGMYFMMMFLSGLAFAVFFMIRKHYLQ